MGNRVVSGICRALDTAAVGRFPSHRRDPAAPLGAVAFGFGVLFPVTGDKHFDSEPRVYLSRQF
jgi:hypothetical protein